MLVLHRNHILYISLLLMSFLSMRTPLLHSMESGTPGSEKLALEDLTKKLESLSGGLGNLKGKLGELSTSLTTLKENLEDEDLETLLADLNRIVAGIPATDKSKHTPAEHATEIATGISGKKLKTKATPENQYAEYQKNKEKQKKRALIFGQKNELEKYDKEYAELIEQKKNLEQNLSRALNELAPFTESNPDRKITLINFFQTLSNTLSSLTGTNLEVETSALEAIKFAPTYNIECFIAKQTIIDLASRTMEAKDNLPSLQGILQGATIDQIKKTSAELEDLISESVLEKFVANLLLFLPAKNNFLNFDTKAYVSHLTQLKNQISSTHTQTSKEIESVIDFLNEIGKSIELSKAPEAIFKELDHKMSYFKNIKETIKGLLKNINAKLESATNPDHAIKQLYTDITGSDLSLLQSQTTKHTLGAYKQALEKIKTDIEPSSSDIIKYLIEKLDEWNRQINTKTKDNEKKLLEIKFTTEAKNEIMLKIDDINKELSTLGKTSASFDQLYRAFKRTTPHKPIPDFKIQEIKDFITNVLNDKDADFFDEEEDRETLTTQSAELDSIDKEIKMLSTNLSKTGVSNLEIEKSVERLKTTHDKIINLLKDVHEKLPDTYKEDFENKYQDPINKISLNIPTTITPSQQQLKTVLPHISIREYESIKNNLLKSYNSFIDNLNKVYGITLSHIPPKRLAVILATTSQANPSQIENRTKEGLTIILEVLNNLIDAADKNSWSKLIYSYLPVHEYLNKILQPTVKEKPFQQKMENLNTKANTKITKKELPLETRLIGNKFEELRQKKLKDIADVLTNIQDSATNLMELKKFAADTEFISWLAKQTPSMTKEEFEAQFTVLKKYSPTMLDEGNNLVIRYKDDIQNKFNTLQENLNEFLNRLSTNPVEFRPGLKAQQEHILAVQNALDNDTLKSNLLPLWRSTINSLIQYNYGAFKALMIESPGRKSPFRQFPEEITKEFELVSRALSFLINPAKDAQPLPDEEMKNLFTGLSHYEPLYQAVIEKELINENVLKLMYEALDKEPIKTQVSASLKKAIIEIFSCIKSVNDMNLVEEKDIITDDFINEKVHLVNSLRYPFARKKWAALIEKILKNTFSKGIITSSITAIETLISNAATNKEKRKEYQKFKDAFESYINSYTVQGYLDKFTPIKQKPDFNSFLADKDLSLVLDSFLKRLSIPNVIKLEWFIQNPLTPANPSLDEIKNKIRVYLKEKSASIISTGKSNFSIIEKHVNGILSDVATINQKLSAFKGANNSDIASLTQKVSENIKKIDLSLTPQNDGFKAADLYFKKSQEFLKIIGESYIILEQALQELGKN